MGDDNGYAVRRSVCSVAYSSNAATAFFSMTHFGDVMILGTHFDWWRLGNDRDGWTHKMCNVVVRYS